LQIRFGNNAILFFVHLPERIAYRKELNQFADPEAEGMPEPSTPDLLGAVLQRGIEIVQGEYQERHWRAFWLTVIEGQSTDVAADKLNMSASMVRQCRSRILRRLRQVMGDLG
jgi:RNA polymerase sigma-70 factor (ECF subfamily)